jgi:CO/xanthine dehydrogenase FAD-binding subunit
MNFEIINPVSIPDLLTSLKNCQEGSFRFAAGCTDLLPELRKNPGKEIMVINLSHVIDKEFTGVSFSSSGLQLGARVTAHQIVINEDIRANFPVLHKAALSLASTQIRQVATVGGNLCTASPSGDISCALVALEAECELLNTQGQIRKVLISDFFSGVRKTVLLKNELLYRINIPVNHIQTGGLHSGFIKVGTRRSMECSVVSLAYHILFDERKNIIKAGVAIGASAPVIRFTRDACDFLTNKNMASIEGNEKQAFAEKVLEDASPISDIRATAWYRKTVLFNISKSIFENTN